MDTKYVMIEYANNAEDDPRQVYAELGADYKELRRVEFYNGGVVFACGGERGSEEALSPTAYQPNLGNLNIVGECEAQYITPGYFEDVWEEILDEPDTLASLLC